MTKLTKAQTAILKTLAVTEGGSATSPGAKAKSAFAPLIKAGLVISIPVDGAESRLMITDAGRKALGPEAEGQAADSEGQALAAGDEQQAPEHDSGDAAAADPAEPPGTQAKPGTPKGKLGVLVELLGREGGATIEDMMAATGWQAHSVRGAISGSLKKKLGLTVASDKTETGRVYSIAPEAA